MGLFILLIYYAGELYCCCILIRYKQDISHILCSGGIFINIQLILDQAIDLTRRVCCVTLGKLLNLSELGPLKCELKMIKASALWVGGPDLDVVAQAAAQ